MMFGMQLVMSIALVAMALGVALYVWSAQQMSGNGIGIAKYFGLVIIALAVVNIVGAWYFGFYSMPSMHNRPKPAMEAKEHSKKMMHKSGKNRGNNRQASQSEPN